MITDLLSKEWNALRDASPEKKLLVFLEYCCAVKTLKEQGTYSAREAAYNICGASFFSELSQNQTLNEIIEFACWLELPEEARPLEGSEEKLWGQLVSLIDSASAQFGGKE